MRSPLVAVLLVVAIAAGLAPDCPAAVRACAMTGEMSEHGCCDHAAIQAVDCCCEHGADAVPRNAAADQGTGKGLHGYDLLPGDLAPTAEAVQTARSALVAPSRPPDTPVQRRTTLLL